ncbi:MAG: signal peptidase II [Faecalibacterium sp.]|jgi:signal peptidase II|nr:signal peptidase II [Faecalibacterium sp.]
MITVILEVLGIAALFFVDQGIKAWATAALAPLGAMPLLPGIVQLRYVLNQGMAFSLLSGKQAFLILVTGAALLALAYYLFAKCRGQLLKQITLVLILSGGLGNLVDRVLNGQVVDYIELQFVNFAVFNFADICVCVGMALLILCIFLEENDEHKKAAAQDPAQKPQGGPDDPADR